MSSAQGIVEGDVGIPGIEEYPVAIEDHEAYGVAHRQRGLATSRLMPCEIDDGLPTSRAVALLVGVPARLEDLLTAPRPSGLRRVFPETGREIRQIRRTETGGVEHDRPFDGTPLTSA